MPEAPAADPLMDPLAHRLRHPCLRCRGTCGPLNPRTARSATHARGPAADPLMDPLAHHLHHRRCLQCLRRLPVHSRLFAQPPADAPADTVVADLTGEQAGAIIRGRAEVEAVPGDKLEGTLHEVETTTLNADGNIIKQNVKGTLTVNNQRMTESTTSTCCSTTSTPPTSVASTSPWTALSPKNHTMSYKVNGKQMMT